MERFNFHFSRRSLRGVLSSLERPDLMWKIILSAMLCAVLVIGVLSFLSYRWATHPTIPTTTTKRIITVSKEEIRSVIELYKAKQERFRELQNSRPVPPALGNEAGIEVPRETTLSEISVTPETAPEPESSENSLPQ